MSHNDDVRPAQARDFLQIRTLLVLLASTSTLVFIHQAWECIGIVALCLVAATSDRHRRWALNLACLGNLFFLENFKQPFGVSPIHLIPLFFFNAIFIALVHHTIFLKKNYLALLASLVLTLVATQLLASHVFDYKLALILTAPITTNIWAYLNYSRVPLSNITFLERIIWLRPFWYRWIIPYGSYVDIKDRILRRPSVNFRKIERFAMVFVSVTVVTFLFENIFFARPYTFAKVAWLPHPFELPILWRDGYQIMFDRFPINESRYAIEQSLIFIATQTLASIHFLLYIGVYSSGAIWTAVLAGFDIELHVRAFWRAHTFSGFYLRMNYHYTYLIQKHLLPVLARVQLPWITGRLRNAWLIGGSIFPISFLSLYFGRTLWIGQVAPEGRLLAALGNYHYSLITALICAANVIIRSEHSTTRAEYHRPLTQAVRVATYFFIFQMSLIFGFQFLKSSLDIKIDYAIVALRIFNPLAY